VELYLLSYNAMYLVENQPMFRRNILSPSSGLKNNPSKIHSESFMLDSVLVFILTLKIEATYSFETYHRTLQSLFMV
jgi:hypothetical protein